MRVQWEILLFMLILNLSFGVIMMLSLPGTAYAGPAANVNVEQYEAQFNATQIEKSWGQNIFSGIPLVGDIYAGFNFLTQNLAYLFDGFPMLLTWVSDSFITDASGQAAFTIISWALRGVEALLISVFLIEFISGRVFSD